MLVGVWIAIVRGMKRRRYIGFHIQSDTVIHRSDFFAALTAHCEKQCIGDMAQFGIKLIRYNGTYGIIRCTHLNKDTVQEIISTLTVIGHQTVLIETMGTSGTIRGLQRQQSLLRILSKPPR
jgi:RNase P/RNase MRP subunit POP5